MELELGLALPVSATPFFPSKSFDLNISTNALTLVEEQTKDIIRQKRSFEEAFIGENEDDDDDQSKTLSLLVWNGRQPNDEKDNGLNGQSRKSFNPVGKNDEEDNPIVGWPPIKWWRKKLILGGGGGRPDQEAERPANFNGGRNSIFVKVKMEGVVIGRKIDITLFDSYQALTNTLLNMFAKYRDNDDKDDGQYILSYLDREGNWLIAGNVPWQIFIESVQRMEILKQSS